MKTKHIIIGLLTLLIVLLSTDLITGIWFWNKYNLIFDSDNFNNILTPIVTFLAVIIYTIALFLTIRQNRIILSQHIKPHFEKEIEELLKEAKKSVPLKIDKKKKKYNLFNYTKLIMDLTIELVRNPEYLEDLKKIQAKENLSDEYVRGRTYFEVALLLNSFMIAGNLTLTTFYGKLKNLIDEINNSKLIEDEKLLLIKRIEAKFLNDYFALIKYFDKHNSPPIPNVITIDRKVEFKPLNESSFRNHYNLFK